MHLRRVEKTNSQIIWTTPIRKAPGGKALLNLKIANSGLKPCVLGYTTQKFGVRRRDKIKMYMDDIDGFIEKFVIFDSREDMGSELNSHLITCIDGIDAEKKERAIKLLNA